MPRGLPPDEADILPSFSPGDKYFYGARRSLLPEHDRLVCAPAGDLAGARDGDRVDRAVVVAENLRTRQRLRQVPDLHRAAAAADAADEHLAVGREGERADSAR